MSDRIEILKAGLDVHVRRGDDDGAFRVARRIAETRGYKGQRAGMTVLVEIVASVERVVKNEKRTVASQEAA